MKSSEDNIDEVITECLNNPLIQSICMRKKDMDIDERNKKEKEFSRVLGFCILFKNSEDIEQYMMITEKEKQIEFLQRKIAKILEIPEDEMKIRKKEIIQYVIENFKINGYVFHGANSASAEKKMTYGLNGNGSSIEHQKQLLRIALIYQKYSNDNPLGWGTMDIKNKKNGWFYDGKPKNTLYYADSPEWFNQFCGGNYSYAFGTVPDKRRHGYTNRDYETCLETVKTLIAKYQMTESDKNEILSFFNNCWNQFGNTSPNLLLIPLKDLKTEKELNFERDYYTKYSHEDEYFQQTLFEDIISGAVTYEENKCCNQSISPANLKRVDLSPILPRFKVQRNKEQEITLEECIIMLKGFDLPTLKKAQKLISSLDIKNKQGEQH